MQPVLRLTTLPPVPIILKSGSLKLLEASGLHQASIGIDLSLLLSYNRPRPKRFKPHDIPSRPCSICIKGGWIYCCIQC